MALGKVLAPASAGYSRLGRVIVFWRLKEKVYIKSLLYLDISRESRKRKNILHGVVNSGTHGLPREEPLYVLT